MIFTSSKPVYEERAHVRESISSYVILLQPITVDAIIALYDSGAKTCYVSVWLFKYFLLILPLSDNTVREVGYAVLIARCLNVNGCDLIGLR